MTTPRKDQLVKDPTTRPPLTTADGQKIDPHAFSAWVEDYPRDALDHELSEALAECLTAAQLYGKVSTFTLKVEIAPTRSHLGDVIVKHRVDSKPAKPTPPEVAFFPTPGGGLSRRDPQQPQIPGTENA